MFLTLFRNILCPQQMFPSLRAQGNVMSNNVSATMCPRLPVPLNLLFTDVLVAVFVVVYLSSLATYSALSVERELSSSRIMSVTIFKPKTLQIC